MNLKEYILLDQISYPTRAKKKKNSSFIQFLLFRFDSVLILNILNLTSFIPFISYPILFHPCSNGTYYKFIYISPPLSLSFYIPSSVSNPSQSPPEIPRME